MNCFNATSRGSSTGSRIALFGPQVTNWTSETLSSLQFALLDNCKLKFLKQAFVELPSLWHLLEESHAFQGFSGADKLQELQDFASGVQNLDPQNLSNTQLSSLTVVSQAVNFIQTTEISESNDVLDFQATQGFCVGFLSAAALASANDWAEFESNFSNAVRLAACIGLIIDAERFPRPAQARATAIHVRWKSPEDRTYLETCLDSFPEAYISCITDDRSITITVPTGSQVDFCKQMRDAKMATTTIGLSGRYHHPSNAEAANTLSRICAENKELRLPDAGKLRVPLRSTANARIIKAGALHEIAIQLILCKRAHWFQTVKSTVTDLSESKASFVVFGGESCVPRSLSAKDTHVSAVSDQEEKSSGEEIAVVGMACRFPRAENIEEFWQLLWAGETAIGKLPPHRFDTAELSREPKLANFWGNFLDSPDVFDHRFFGISGREAKSMDPQQRLALQVAYEALESSGYCNKALKLSEDDVGCYLGVGSVDYEDNVASHDANAFAATGTLRAFISGRISHFFGWSGPSITFDTACSSSAVAIHTASKAILGGECSMALAGGVNVITSPALHQNLAAASFLNPNGSSRAFDAEANGYCRGEGAGILVLKKLSKAVADGNSILGVIAGSAVNQGSSCSPITVPDSNSQSSLYKRVLSSARIDSKDVTYVEAHGTGTPVGDPIEYESVRLALASPSREDKIFLGSVKDNIGHTEAASGVAGVIKSLLMMQYKTIPKQANFKSLNPRIEASASEQITVPNVTQLWTAQSRIALVNNYGAAGSNVAVVLRAYSSHSSHSRTDTSLGTQTPTSIVSPILLSAKTANSLQSYLDMLNLHLRKVENSFENVAYNIARNHNPSFEHRLAFIAADEENAMSVLSSSSAAMNGTAVRPTKKSVVLCFGGQTNRSVSVSIELYKRCDLFKNRLDECDSVCHALGLPSIFPGIFQGDAIEDVVSLHCMLLSLQVSCARCWLDCGLEVDTMIGHSFGQFAALCVAGSIGLKDAFLFVSSRARLIRDCWGPDRGTMLSVECDRDNLEAVVRRVNSMSGVHVNFACYNGPRSFVLAGDGPSIEIVEKECSTFKKTRLRNGHAYHSYLTDVILDDLADITKLIKMQPPRIRVETCSAGGTWSQFTVGKMVQHTRDPVYFADAVERITSRLPSAIWLEAGSSNPIIAMTRRVTVLKSGRSDIFIPMELGNSDAITHLAKAACQLWTAGSAAQHWLFHPSSRYRYQNLNLPPYQFEKSRHWIVNKPRSEPTTKEAPSLVTLLNKDGATTGEHLFAVDTTNDIFELAARGHAVAGQSLCPASMYIELAARCVMVLRRTDNKQETQTLPHIEGLTMSAPLGLGAGTAVFSRLRKTGTETWEFTLFSQPSLPHDLVKSMAKETEHAKGSISSFAAGDAVVEKQLRLLQRSSTHRIQKLPSATGINGAMVYGLFSDVVEYASYYQGVRSVSASENEAVGHVTSPTERLACMNASVCDLISLDNFLQVAGIHVNCLSKKKDDHVYMCTAVEEIIFSAAFVLSRGDTRTWTTYTRYEHTSKAEVSNDIFVCDAISGALVLAILGANFRCVPLKWVARSLTKINKPTTTHGLASLQRSESEDLRDSAYQTESPSSAEDILAAKQSFDAPVRRLSKDLPPSRTVAIAQQPNNLIQLICRMFSAILEIPFEEIRPTSSLEELGIDSLLATEVLSEILIRFNVSLTQAQLITCTDVLSLVQLIQHGETIHQQHKPVAKSGHEQESGQKLTNGAHLTHEEHLTNGDTCSKGKKLINRDSLTNGYYSPSRMEKSQPTYDYHESHINLAVESRECFISAKASYDHYADITGFTSFCSEAFPIQSMLVVQYVVNAFASLGSSLQELESGDQVPAFKFDPRHEKLVPQLYKILVDAGLVAKRAEERFHRTSKPIPTLDTSALLDEILDRFAKHTSEMKLLYTTGHRLADCLSGSADPISLIFGDAAARTLLEDVYTNAPMFKTGTLVLAHYLSMVLERVGTSRELNILELGAGTGGTSKNVIDSLVKLGLQYRFSYTFTDLSPSLVATARRKFAKWPFMRYTVLDIEKEPDPEFLGAYDIILSTNCIHATKNLVQSTTNIRKMLRPDGVLCLVELTRNLYWFDLVFGLLEGWWLFNDGREHALANERRWERELYNSGFRWVDWSDSTTLESGILRVITASPQKVAPHGIISRLALGNGSTTNSSSDHNTMKETLTFKEVDGLELLADVYYPPEVVEHGRTLPVALMIHGGGHIMLSKNDIRPEQTSKLLQSGFLPISVNYRLCPETNLVEGPMTDVADALHWIRTILPQVPLSRSDVHINHNKVVAVGWSTGGHLAMTLAWTSLARQIRPPEAILAFYCPTDYEDPFWMKPNVPAGASSDTYDLDSKVLEGIYDKPITGYNVPAKKRALGGWLAPSDARSRLALHMNTHGHTLHVLLGGLSPNKKTLTNTSLPPPTAESIRAASPLSQIRIGNYTTPTFLIHPRDDDLIPWQQAERTWQALREQGVQAELRVVEGVPHLFDVYPRWADHGAVSGAVREGYSFLARAVGLRWCE